MKKTLLYPIIISLLASCSETESTNNPSNSISSSDTITANDSASVNSIGDNKLVTEFITNENVYPEQDKLLFSYSNKSYKLEYSINVDTTQGQLSEIEGYNGELTIYRAHKVTVDLELFLDNASLWKKTVGISDLFGEHSYEGYDIVSETVTDNTLLVNEDFFKEWLMTTVRVSQALGEIYIHFEFTRNPEMMDEIWEITPAFTTDGQSVIRVESHDTFN